MNRQRGLSLIVVILALLIISFAATALLRSTDTATLITGNLAFKKAALASGDAAAEQALAWLNTSSAGTVLLSDQPGNGYYATSADGCDLTGSRTPSDKTDDVNWTSSQVNTSCAMYALKVTPTGVASGYTVAYVINRMCNASGDPLSLLAGDGVTR